MVSLFVSWASLQLVVTESHISVEVSVQVFCRCGYHTQSVLRLRKGGCVMWVAPSNNFKVLRAKIECDSLSWLSTSLAWEMFRNKAHFWVCLCAPLLSGLLSLCLASWLKWSSSSAPTCPSPMRFLPWCQPARYGKLWNSEPRINLFSFMLWVSGILSQQWERWFIEASQRRNCLKLQDQFLPVLSTCQTARPPCT